MNSSHTVIHKGKTVLIVDVSNSQPGQVGDVLVEAHKKVAQMGPKSALILLDATNAVYNATSSSAIKDFSSKNTPFVKASAVVGADGLRAVLLQTVAIITGREIKSCKSRAEALDWLVARN